MHKNKRDSLTPRAEQIIKNEKLLFTCCKNKKKSFLVFMVIKHECEELSFFFLFPPLMIMRPDLFRALRRLLLYLLKGKTFLFKFLEKRSRRKRKSLKGLLKCSKRSVYKL